VEDPVDAVFEAIMAIIKVIENAAEKIKAKFKTGKNTVT